MDRFVDPNQREAVESLANQLADVVHNGIGVKGNEQLIALALQDLVGGYAQALADSIEDTHERVEFVTAFDQAVSKMIQSARPDHNTQERNDAQERATAAMLAVKMPAFVDPYEGDFDVLAFLESLSGGNNYE